jgi:hypothetical protein
MSFVSCVMMLVAPCSFWVIVVGGLLVFCGMNFSGVM